MATTSTTFAETEPWPTRDAEKYNFLPLIMRPELTLDDPNSLQDVLVANLVQDQGYEVHCAAPQWHMAPSVFGDVQKYLDPKNYKGPVYLRGYKDPYTVDMTNSRIAMMRGDEDTSITNKISSLEGLVGVVNPELPPDETNSRGAVYQLLNPEVQCNLKVKTMNEMWAVMEKLGCRSNCAINVKIPESPGIHMTDLMKVMNGAREKFNDNAAFCGEFVKAYDPAIHKERMGFSNKADLAGWSDALNHYSIDQNLLYRTGFLVVSIRQNRDEDLEGFDDVFWFRKQPEDINATLDAPIVVAFKIPDFATNKSALMSKFKDTSKILNDLHWDPEQIKVIDKDSKEVRTGYMAAIKAKRYEFPILKYCALYPCRSGPEEILQRAVIDIINGIGNACGESYMPLENAGDIGSPGLINGDNRLPIAPYFPYVIPSDRRFVFDWEVVVEESEAYRNVSGQTMRVVAHLVVPLGTDLKYVESTLKALFQPGAYEAMEAKNVMVDYENKLGVPEYYPIKESIAFFKTSTPQHTYTDYTAPPVCEYNRLGIWVCKYPTKRFGASISPEGQEQFRILGARLGWMIRKLQETVRQPHLQIKCTRTEDLFLGRCQIEPNGEEETPKCTGEAFKKITGLPPSSGIPQYAKGVYDSEIEPGITESDIEAYEYAEKETGIPCEVVAGIHWTEGANDPSQSVFDGGALRGALKEDAKAAMEHLKSFWPGGFNKDSISYQDLTIAIGGFNGPGNMNCSSDLSGQQRPTRWRGGGKCPAQFQSEDHPHPLGWIDERHSDMDLIYCLDFVEFSCNIDPNVTEMEQLRAKLESYKATYGLTDERIEQLMTSAASYCYSNSTICQSLAEGRKYPKYERPGSITTAILLNESGAAAK